MADEKKRTADDKFDQLADALAKFMTHAQDTSLSGDKLEAILNKVGLSTAQGMQKAMRPENEIPPLMSAFNPLGDNITPKQPLTRKTFLNGHPEHSSETSLQADMLIQAEVDAYNELGVALEAQGDKRLFARNDLYRAELRNRNTELHVEVPVATLDTRQNLPPTLIMLCHELKTGESMMDLNDLLSEVTRLRAEVQRLGGSKAQPVRSSAKQATITASGGPLVADLQKALDETPTTALTGA